MAYMNGSSLGAPLADYGTFNGWVGLAAPKKKKKKRGFFRKVGRVAKKVGKVALKAAPVVAGLTLGPAGGVVVGAASGAIGRGRPKLKRILRGAAIGGATGLIRTGQAGRILVKGARAAGRLAKAGGRIVSKIPKEVVGGGVIGAGGGAIVDIIQKKRRQAPDEPLTPEESGPVIDTSTPQQECEARGGIWTRSGCVMTGPPPRPLPPDLTTNGGGEGPAPQAAPQPGEAPPSPMETPTSGQLPVAGGLIPGPAVGAVLPGTGGEQFAPSVAEGEEAPPDDGTRKTALLIAAGVAVAVLAFGGSKRKGRRR